MRAPKSSTSGRRRAVIVAGHKGDITVALQHAHDDDANVRASSLVALDRNGVLTDEQIVAAFGDHDPLVRRRAAALAGKRAGLSLLPLLSDPDSTVVEVAAWACGEQEDVTDQTLMRLIDHTTSSDDPLVREASAAALGAIGDERGLPAIITACSDKPHIRRRAVLALAPFDGPDVEAAIDQALADRDWQVRQGAEDIRRASGDLEIG